MAVRLKEAVPEKGATQPGPIAAALYQKAKHGIPECAGCRAKLKHTPAHSKHGGSIRVKAHFGLRRGHKHAFGCKYDIDATLRKIVAKSREVRDLGATALVEHVGSPEQETVEFRLHVLLTGLEPEQILGRQDKDPEKAYAYQDSKRRLSSYMNCVESIIMVADVVGDDAQLEEKVHVVFNGEKIPWRDFFFGFKEHRRLWRARDKTQGRPVTLEFERLDLERNAAPYRANGHYQISGRFGLDEGNPPYNVQVQLQVEDRALADAIWAAKQVVVCGVPRFRTADFARWRPGSYFPFAHIVLPVRDWSQVFAIGGGPLEAPHASAADERSSRVAPRDTAVGMPVPGSGVPAVGMPPSEAQSPQDVPPVEDGPPGGNAPEHPEPEEDKPAASGADKTGDVVNPNAGDQVPSSRRADPGPDAVSLDPQPIDDAPSEAEVPGNAESVAEWRPETEEAIARPDDGAAPARTPAVAAETQQLTVVGDTAPTPVESASQMPEQEHVQLSPHDVAVTASPLMPVASNTRLRRSRGPMARAAKAVKQGAAKVVEHGRSAGRRFAAWFGGSD